MKADVVLILVSFVLCDAEQNSIFHLHPELTVFVFQLSFIFLLEQKWKPHPHILYQ